MDGATNRPILSPSTVGLFIGFEQCPRYLKQSLNQIAGNEDELGVFLSETGDRFEEETLSQLEADAADCIDAKEKWEVADDVAQGHIELQHYLSRATEKATATEPVLIEQPPARGRIGAWKIKGRGDLLAIWKTSQGFDAHILEVKASRDVQPYHQIQACIYQHLFRDVLEGITGSDSVTVKTGIVHRNTDELDLTDISTLPVVDEMEVVEEDVERLLSDDGVIDRIYERDDIKYTLDGKCNYCLYNESCFSHAVENQNLAILGLTEGEQRILEKHDITTVEELASLKEKVRKPKPHDFEELPALQSNKVQKLLDEPSLGGRIDDIVQNAQSVLGGLNPGHPQGRTSPLWGSALQGTGEGAVPATNPSPGQAASMDYDADELIRVYLYVREDYMRDTIAMLSGRVVRNNSAEDPISFSVVADDLPDDREAILSVEADLLTRFFTQLFTAIHTVAGGDEEAPMHLYFYSRTERDTLVESILRQMPRYDKESLNAVRDLMGYRRAIEQPMVSIMQDELIERFALRYPGNGILPVLEQASSKFCDCGCSGKFKKEEWRVTREGGFAYNLRDVFKTNFFTFKLPVERGPDGYREPAKNAYNPSEFYPLRARFDNQIPLEYFWAANDKLTPDWANKNEGNDGQEKKKDEQQLREIEQYRWHKPERTSTRITTEDIGLLGEKLCHALQHIESSAGQQNPFLGKEPINIPDLPEFNLGEINLARSLSDYLDLEHFSDRQEKYKHYAKSPRERVRSGYAAIIEVEDVSRSGDNLLVSGSLLYDDREFNDSDKVAYSCRIKGGEESAYGSFRLANPVNWNEAQGAHKDERGTPRDLEKGLPVEVQTISMSDRSITIQLSDFNTENSFIPNKNPSAYPYVPRHAVWTDNPAEEGFSYGVRIVYVREGDRFILDRQTDDWTSNHASKVLDELQEHQEQSEQTGLDQFQPTPSFTGQHHFYQVLNQLIGGHN